MVVPIVEGQELGDHCPPSQVRSMSDFKKKEKRRHKDGKSKNDKDAKKKLVLKEIEDLDGDAEDYELIAGIDSDQEDSVADVVKTKSLKPSKQDAKLDAALAKDLKKFAKGLGLKPGTYLEQATVDDDDQSDYEVQVQSVDKPLEVSKALKKEKKAAQVGEDDFKIHAKREAPIVQGGHANRQPLLEPTPLWHDIQLKILDGIPEDPPAEFVINRHFEKAKGLLAAENEFYSVSNHVKSSDRQFLSTIMRSGTLSDRVSALTLVVQESPIHATKSMDALMSMCRKKGRNEAVSAVGAVKDLMQASVLPNRKLQYFKDQAGVAARDVTDQHLIVWAFEDFLKRYYFELLGVMESLSMDPLPFPRNHMVRYLFDLLKDKPEQEANLLRLLTNKLGDKDKKIASKCSHFCLQLMQAHPMMKAIIVRELEQVLFKPTISQSAQYYVIITLNQTILSTKDADVANRLIELYFTFFTKLINMKESTTVDKVDEASNQKKNRKAQKKERLAEDTETAEEELNSKMISAVLTGVNRAFPFSQLDDNAFAKNLDTLYKVTHSSNFNTSVQALILIHQVAVAKEETADRFYRTLYESISDPRLITSSKQALYLNLLFKSLKSDKNVGRTKAFVKRLVQSASMHSPPFICALFFLFSELEMAVPAIRQLTVETHNAVEQDQLLTPPSESADEVKELTAEPVAPISYDGRARDPRFSHAEKASLWEMIPFLTHFHPSVCLFAKSWLLREQMPSKPDLSLHTISHFLDRFVYRNAKTKSTNKGGSIMQPLAGGDTRGMILQQSGANQQPVNSESFYKQAVQNVAADEMFFYQYFSDKMSRTSHESSTKKAKKLVEQGADPEEDDVWQALVQSRPDVEAPSDDSDVDEGDLEDLAAAMSDSEDAEASEDEEAGNDGPEFNESDFEADEFGEDEDDLLPSENDEDVEDEEFNGFDGKPTKKRKAGAEDESESKSDKKKKKKVKLPTLASADDYMHLIDA